MARFIFFHNALGKTDGVSLEVDKWRWCLEQMGHEVFYCAGNNDVDDVHCIPELDFFHPVTRNLIENATVELKDFTEQELGEAIVAQAQIIKGKLETLIEELQPDCLIPNNLLSVGYHIPALIALSEVIRETGLPTIVHNHDFYFEDSGEVSPTCEVALNFLEEFAPPSDKNVVNLVINRLAQNALKERKGLDARVVPNVFDFNQAAWVADQYSSDFRAQLGIADNDIVFLQATRVMNRKGIELAIDVAARVKSRKEQLIGKTLYNGKTITDKSDIVLLCAGRVESFGISNDYKASLEKRAKQNDLLIIFAGDRIKHSRTTHPERGKIYSLWDSYVHSDFVTYPSWWEGWGNQFIEALFARLPVVLFEYPVFKSDLKKDGFSTVSLGDSLLGPDADGLFSVAPEKIEAATDDIIPLLIDKEHRSRVVEANYQIAREHYSYEQLSRIIAELLKQCGIN